MEYRDQLKYIKSHQTTGGERRPERNRGRNSGKRRGKKRDKEVMRKRDSPENYQQSQAS